MKKVTKKKQIEDLQTAVSAQWRQINKLKLHLGRLVDIDWSDEQADHDELMEILDSKEPKLKVLDQSVFDGLDAKWRFAVIDSDGERIVYADKPIVRVDVHWWRRTDGRSYLDYLVLDDDGYDASDWKNSLIERDIAKELTGSDLARAMLERGDMRVVCLVSDDSDKHAVERREITSLIEGFSLRSGFYTERSEYWVYAVPVNVATNEPLTQSDVGL